MQLLPPVSRKLKGFLKKTQTKSYTQNQWEYLNGCSEFHVMGLILSFRIWKNGRYVQYDMRRNYSPDGRVNMSDPEYKIIDTRTGKVIYPNRFKLPDYLDE